MEVAGEPSRYGGRGGWQPGSPIVARWIEQKVEMDALIHKYLIQELANNPEPVVNSPATGANLISGKLAGKNRLGAVAASRTLLAAGVFLILALVLFAYLPIRAAPSSDPPTPSTVPARIPKQPEAILSDLRKILPEDWTCQLVLKPGAVGLGTLPSVDPLFCIEFTNPEELSSEIYPLDKPPPPPTLRLYFLPADGSEKEQFEEKSKLRPWLYLAFAETPDYLVLISPTKISVDQDGGPYLIRCIAPLGRALTNYFGKPTDVRIETQLGLTGHGAGELTTDSGFAGQVVDGQTGKPIKKFRLEFDPKASDLNDGPLIYLSAPGNFFAGRFAIEGRHLSSFLSFGEMKWENPPLWPAGQRVTGQVKADGYLPAPLTPDPVVWPVKLTNLMIRLKRVRASVQQPAVDPARASSNPQSIPPPDPVPAPAEPSKPAENPPGLTVEIHCTNNVFKQGDEIPIQIIFRNQGTQACYFERGPNLFYGGLGGYKLTARTSSGEVLPDPEARPPNNLQPPIYRPVWHPDTFLRPGDSVTNVVPLNRWAVLSAPGAYEIVGSYDSLVFLVLGPYPHDVLPKELMDSPYGPTAARPFNDHSAPRRKHIGVNSTPMTITLLPRSKEEAVKRTPTGGTDTENTAAKAKWNYAPATNGLRAVIGKLRISALTNLSYDDFGVSFYNPHRELSGRTRHQDETGKVVEDGTFRVDDVTPGRWWLLAQFICFKTNGQGKTVATFGKPVVVPEMPAGRNGELLDLGTLEPFIVHSPQIGEPAPLIEVETTNFGNFKLGDHRGQYVLLDFEGEFEGFDRETLSAVASLGTNDRLTILTVWLPIHGYDNSGRDHDYGGYYSWPVARWTDLPWCEQLTLRASYGLPVEISDPVNLPSIFLVGPDGKIVARDLRGQAIKVAVAKALATANTKENKTLPRH